MTELISAKNLTYRYGSSRIALNNISLVVGQGEGLGLLGPNGAGKTTLFLLLSGLLRPSSGQLYWRQAPFSYDRKCLMELRQKALVFPQGHEFKHLSGSVAEVVAGSLLSSGLAVEEAWKRAEEMLAKLELADFKTAFASSLSFGQRKMVALASFLAMEPELMLLDEPTSSLDPLHARLVMEMVKERISRGSAVILASQETGVVYPFASRVVVMDRGEIIDEGLPEVVLCRERAGPKPSLNSPWLLTGSRVLLEQGQLLKHEFPVKAEERFWEVLVRAKKPKIGVTTGTVAAAAAFAAAWLMYKEEQLPRVQINTPAGIIFELLPDFISGGRAEASCGIKKEAGDDPDITDGLLIVATVRKSAAPGVKINGGHGIGIVTEPGLSVPVGEPAINPVPRQQIASVLIPLLAPGEGLEVTIEVPEGEKLAPKTFNPLLGIKGGISILGTSGVVIPFSREAYIDSLVLQLKQAVCLNLKPLVFVLGNKSKHVARKCNVPESLIVQTGNYVGEMLKAARDEGIKDIILIGYGGKLAKTYLGIHNTYSKVADGRNEAWSLFLALQGAAKTLIHQVLDCKNFEQVLAVLNKEKQTGYILEFAKEIRRKLESWLGGEVHLELTLTDIQGNIAATTITNWQEGWPWVG